MHAFMRAPSSIRSSIALCTGAILLAACGSDSAPTEPAVSAAGSTGTTASAPAGAAGATNVTNTVASRCNGTIAAIIVSDVVVPRGATCVLNGTRVRGNVQVAFDATVTATDARIDGSIQAEDARAVNTAGGTIVQGDVQAKRRTAVRVENSTIRGNLHVEEFGAAIVAADSRVGGDVKVEKADRAALTRVSVAGDVKLGENGGALRAELLQVEGNMQVEKNRGGVVLLTNRIRQVLECKENAPAPTGSGNVAGDKLEQCRAL